MYLNEKSKHLNEKCFAYDLVPVIDDKYEGIGRILNSSNLRHTKNASLMPIEPARRMNLSRDAISA